MNEEKLMLYFVDDYFRLNGWYKKKIFSLLSFFIYNWMTIVHKVNRYIFFLVNIKKRKKKILEKLLTKSDAFDRIHTFLLNNGLTYTHTYISISLLALEKDVDGGVIINIANHSTCWWCWWMLTTTRLCALFICLLRQCKTHSRMQEAVTAKKSLWSPSHSSLSPSSSSFYTQRDYYLIILNTCALLNIKYQVLPLESSSSSLIQIRAWS